MIGFIKNKLFIKIVSYIIIGVIFLFLFNSLRINWQKIQEYNFSFNYAYLIFSVLILAVTTIFVALIWKGVIKILESGKEISNFEYLQIFVYSIFGKYIPGKIWGFVGRSYLGGFNDLSSQTIWISIVYEVVLSVMASFLFSLFLLSIFFRNLYSGFYFISIISIIAGFILIHPKIFYRLVNFILKIFRKPLIDQAWFLQEKHLLKILLLYGVNYIFIGAGFFFLIRSITFLPFDHLIWAIGGFVLATALGTVFIFTPAGLGVREGFLVIFLQSYFPLPLAIFISLVSRMWTIAGDIILASGIWVFSKIKKY